MSLKLAKPGRAAKRNRHASASTHADAALSAELIHWYERHHRRLPWRVGPHERRRGVRPDPYRVWLSEVMLQQTTVKAVAPYFVRFIERWPTITDLANANERDVMAAWAGLGYYSRARNLVAAARVVAAEPGTRFPEDAAALARLPGIGAYTAAAIAAIAFDAPEAAVDGNAERVAARLFAIATPKPALKATVRNVLRPLVPPERAGEFAEALMDLGATICTPRKPACTLCPWSSPCQARRAGRQEELPRRSPRRHRPLRHGTAYVARRADGAILLRRRPPRGLLGSMSEVPGTDWREEPTLRQKRPFVTEWVALSAPVEHVFTHFSLRLSVERAEVAESTPAPTGHWWASAGSLADEALPSVMKKAVEAAYPGATMRPRQAP